MDAQSGGGNQVISSLGEINKLIVRVRDESANLRTLGEDIVKDIYSLRAM
jgi:hypothetical protein